MHDSAGRRAVRWWTALRAAWDLTRFWVLVRVRPQTLAAWSVPAVRLPAVEPDARQPDAVRVVAIVARVARMHPLRPACLERSLAGCAALRRHGIHATVVIGVRRHGPRLMAHAWIDAAPDVRDPDASDYAALPAPLQASASPSPGSP